MNPDAVMRSYLIARDARFNLASKSLSITGHVSACHRDRIYEQPDGRGWRCWKCKQPCALEAAAQSALSLGTSAPNPGIQESQRIGNWEAFRRLQSLVEPIPRGLKRREWWRSLLAWECFLHHHVSGYARVAELGTYFHGDEWTEGAVRGWISQARTVVKRRQARSPKRLAC